MTVNQISIFLENKYGKLSEILALLAEEKIRIIAATVADTSEYGILRIIVSDPQKAYKILKGNNVSANLTDVLAIVTNSCAGSFAQTLSCFTKAGVSIEYMYCFSANEKSILILRTNNREAAREVIRRHKTYDQLRLGETADTDSQNKRGYEGIPLWRTGHRHGRPSLVSYLLKTFRDKRGDFRQLPVGFDKAHIHHPIEPK